MAPFASLATKPAYKKGEKMKEREEETFYHTLKCTYQFD